MTRAKRLQLAKRQDRDRREIERICEAAARRATMDARIRAMRMWEWTRRQDTTINAVHDAVLALLPTMRRALVAAHLRGRYRTRLNVGSLDVRRLEAAREANRYGTVMLARTTFTESLNFLQTRMGLSARALTALEEQYNSEAVRVINGATRVIERKLEQAILDSTRQGLSTKRGMELLRKAFDDAGLAPGNSWHLETLFRTETQKAYAAGRWNSLQEPEIKEIVTALQYTAIDDNRTTPLCQKLDGTTLPMEHPFWRRYTPPNHYNCRSTLLEVFADEKVKMTKEPDLEGIQVFADFQVNFGELFRDMVSLTSHN